MHSENTQCAFIISCLSDIAPIEWAILYGPYHMGHIIWVIYNEYKQEPVWYC